MMKIGLISDIHADLKSLTIALDILQGQGADRVICCGDLVDKGMDGDAVVDLLQERGIPSVMGNHDYLAPVEQRWLRQHYGPTSHHLLTQKTLDYLSQLPATLEFLWENQQILLAHGTPKSWDDYLYSYSPRPFFEQVFSTPDTNAVILGHTHSPMMVRVKERWVFNPGSVCGSLSEGSSTCATLNLPDLTFRVFDLRSGAPVLPAYIAFK